jgi:hypothetical protein
MRKYAVLVLGLCLLGHVSGAGAVIINVGDDLQAAVTANPAGTTFTLKPGVHRHQQVIPKDNMTFEGDGPGVILSGARLLTVFTQEGANYVASGQTQQGLQAGSCSDGYEGCWYPEDFFIDDVQLWHVRTLGDVAPGTWFFDYGADKVYFRDNPAGRKVEIGVTPYAFAGDTDNVTIRHLVIEKYAVPAQSGAIYAQDWSTGTQLSQGWVIERCEIRQNHGGAIRTSHGMQILNNFLHHNGQIGLVGTGDNMLIANNELAYNNTVGFSTGWEAGGSKWVSTNNLIVRNNRSHHNQGPGLWTDGDNVGTLYEYNVVHDNRDAGIFHEISGQAIIRYNRVTANGIALDNTWLYGAQILISTSKDVEVYGNTITVAAINGNGIALIQQDRGTGPTWTYVTTGNSVHHNTTTYRGNSGRSGAAADFNTAAMLAGGNSFDSNTYYAPILTSNRWAWGADTNWEGFQAAGQELNGSAFTQKRRKMLPVIR